MEWLLYLAIGIVVGPLVPIVLAYLEVIAVVIWAVLTGRGPAAER